jgi:hypothetical protein
MKLTFLLVILILFTYTTSAQQYDTIFFKDSYRIGTVISSDKETVKFKDEAGNFTSINLSIIKNIKYKSKYSSEKLSGFYIKKAGNNIITGNVILHTGYTVGITTAIFVSPPIGGAILTVSYIAKVICDFSSGSNLKKSGQIIMNE